MQEVPAVWKDNFQLFSDESLHLFARIYLYSGADGSRSHPHSREMIIEALWRIASREDFIRKTLARLDHFDTELLLLLHLGVESIRQLADFLQEHTIVVLALRLLNLQERFLVMQQATSQDGRGAIYTIAPQFRAVLGKHLNFRKLFGATELSPQQLEELQGAGQVPRRRSEDPEEGSPGSDPSDPKSNPSGRTGTKLLLNNELVLASALYFAQENIPLKRKFGKGQISKFISVFPELAEDHIYILRKLAEELGLLHENAQGNTEFSEQSFLVCWDSPPIARFLALQAKAGGFSSEAFAKLLCIWPQNIALDGENLCRLFTLLGIAKEHCADSIWKFSAWGILLCITNPEGGDDADREGKADDGSLYILNPQLRRAILAENSTIPESQQLGTQNHLSANWELYTNLRYPKALLSLLLCSQLERFDELSLFHIEKSRFQLYFNAEQDAFDHFVSQLPELERLGIQISALILQQWQEWFIESQRFQLFKDCILVCQPSSNDLISHLLGAENSTLILSNPQPGVFYLDEEQKQVWQAKLLQAGLSLSRPFTKAAKGNKAPAQAAKPPKAEPPKAERVETRVEKRTSSLSFPFQMVLEQWQHSAAEAAPGAGEGVSLEPVDTVETMETAGRDSRKPQKGPHSAPSAQEPSWICHSSEPAAFLEQRSIVLNSEGLGSPSKLPYLHLHFREARGVDYNAKRNLIQSLLQSHNRMAQLTVAEGDDLELVSYWVLPLSLEPPKEDPQLVGLDMQVQKLCRFRVKDVTRVNEVFYSLINLPIFSLLPKDFLAELKAQWPSQGTSQDHQAEATAAVADNPDDSDDSRDPRND